MISAVFRHALAFFSQASWEYKATSAQAASSRGGVQPFSRPPCLGQVNNEILRLATYFGFAQLHEHAVGNVITWFFL